MCLFGAGLLAARAVVPEWRIDRIGEEDLYSRRIKEVAPQLSLHLLPQEPRFNLVAYVGDLPVLYKTLGVRAPAWLAAEKRAVTIAGTQSALDLQGRSGRLLAVLSMAGEPWYLEWSAADALVPGATGSAAAHEPLVAALLRSGEKVSRLAPDIDATGSVYSVFAVERTDPPQVVFAESHGIAMLAFRCVSNPKEAIRVHAEQLVNTLLAKIPEAVLLLASIVVVGVLLFRKRLIVWETGLLVSLGSLLTSFLVMGAPVLSFVHLFPLVLLVLYRGLLVLAVWIAAQSLLVGGSAGAAPALADLVSWHPARRGGSQILAGGVVGVAAAGVHLLAASIAVLAPGVFPLDLSLPVQTPNFDRNPFYTAALLSGLVVLAEALARRVRTRVGRSLPALAWAAVFLSLYSSWGPWLFGFVCALPIAALLLVALRRFGTAGLLSASVVLNLLPLTVFATLHREWLPVTLFTAAGFQGTLLGLGALLLVRPHERERRVRLFVSYARKDARALNMLKSTLQGLTQLEFWCDREILPSVDWNREIHERIDSADVVIVLVSGSLLDSTYSNGVEIERALWRNRRGRVRVIPVVLEPCPWRHTRLGEIQGLEVAGAWEPVSAGIECLVNEIVRVQERRLRPVWRD